MAEMPRFLTASAEIALTSPQDVMKRLCAHFAEFGDATVEGRCARIDTGFGTASMEACERCLKVLAAGRDDTALEVHTSCHNKVEPEYGGQSMKR